MVAEHREQVKASSELSAYGWIPPECIGVQMKQEAVGLAVVFLRFWVWQLDSVSFSFSFTKQLLTSEHLVGDTLLQHFMLWMGDDLCEKNGAVKTCWTASGDFLIMPIKTSRESLHFVALLQYLSRGNAPLLQRPTYVQSPECLGSVFPAPVFSLVKEFWV